MKQAHAYPSPTFLQVVLVKDIEFTSFEHERILIKTGSTVYVDVSEDIGWDGGQHYFTLPPGAYIMGS